jgi:hypothetical protein
MLFLSREGYYTCLQQRDNQNRNEHDSLWIPLDANVDSVELLGALASRGD